MLGDHLQRADQADELVGGLAGHQRPERAHGLAGVGGAGDPDDALLGGQEGGLRLLGLRDGGLGGGVLGDQGVAGLVELLGDDLELVTAGGDELGGLGRGGRVPRRGLSGDPREQDADDGGEREAGADGREPARCGGCESPWCGGSPFSSTAAYRVS